MMSERAESEQRENPSVFVDFIGFGHTSEAFGYIISSPQYVHDVDLKIEIPKLSVVVNGMFGKEQTVTIATDKRSATLPRSTMRQRLGISVSADPDSFTDVTPARSINIVLGKRDDPDLERGLVWVYVMNPDSPRIHFRLLPQEHTEKKLKEIFGRASNGAIEYLMDSLNGNIPQVEYSTE